MGALVHERCVEHTPSHQRSGFSHGTHVSSNAKRAAFLAECDNDVEHKMCSISVALTFHMDGRWEEREGGDSGVMMACTKKELCLEKWPYTIMDAPRHKDFIKNKITTKSQTAAALTVVPANGNVITIASENRTQVKKNRDGPSITRDGSIFSG